MKLLPNLSVGAGTKMGPNRIDEKKKYLVKVIIEFNFQLVAFFQLLHIMLSSLLLTHCLMIGDIF